MPTTQPSAGASLIWLRGVAGLALLLACGFAAVYVMGRRLPAEHHAIASGRVEASQDVVWSLITHPATHVAWREGPFKMSLQPGDTHCWVEAYRSMTVLLCPVEEVPKTRMVVRMDGQHNRFRDVWTYTLEPLGPDATQLTVRVDGLVNAPLWRFLGHYAMGGQTNAKQFLADLQAEAVRKR